MGTYRTPEAHLMPFSIQSHYGLIGDGFGASFAAVSVLGQVTFLAEGGSFDVHELGSDQLSLASAANEVIFVPVDSHSLDAFLKRYLQLTSRISQSIINVIDFSDGI